jgi:hypothetical protein
VVRQITPSGLSELWYELLFKASETAHLWVIKTLLANGTKRLHTGSVLRF